MYAIALVFLAIAPVAAQAEDDVMVVFDGSNSMWGQIDGTAKIEIARDAMGSLLGDWAETTNLGLMAYGHRREGDCTDIETLIQPAPANREAIMAQIAAITPRGKTPLTSAVEQAAEALAYRDKPATVILISDGIESCQRDPCALAETLETAGIGFTAHVIGFGLGSNQDQSSLACIAENTGGRYLTAANAPELSEALKEVSAEVAEPPAPPTTAEYGWSLEVGTNNYGGKLAYLTEDGDATTLRLVNDDAVNLVLTGMELDVGTYDRIDAFLAFGRGETCIDELDAPFRVTVTAASDTLLAGSYDGTLTCNQDTGIRQRAIGAFRFEMEAQ